jgi:hypothetical protein
MRLLEARQETRTFLQLREMVEGVHIQSSKRRLSFMEWACIVFHKSWLELCMSEAARAGSPGAAAGDEQLAVGVAAVAERKALYEAQRRTAEQQERAEGEREQRELAQRRAQLRRFGERFEQ